MRIVHIQGGFSPEHGGPAHSLSNYCLRQARNGHDVSAWVLEGFPHTSPAIRLPAPIETVVHPLEFPRAMGRSGAMRRRLAAAPSPDLFHLHGAWLRAVHYGAREARRRKVPYLIELMGMYEPYGLQRRRREKQVLRWWFQDEVLRRASLLHVNSQREGDQLRRLGFRAPLAVLHIGVDTDTIDARTRAGHGACPWPKLDGRPFLLFLSRVHEKKGIELLLPAWAECAARHRDWMLVICGTGAPDYIARCQTLAAQLGIAERCVWTGAIRETEKAWAYTHAGCYVLPTYSENYGNTVAEALAHGTPVITTDTTPWRDVVAQQCGWIAEPAIASITTALAEALAAGPAELRARGARGAAWARAEFSLNAVIAQLEQVYRWLRGDRRPDFVQ